MGILDIINDAEALAFNRRLTEKHQAESTARQTEESRLHRAAIQSRQSAWDKKEKARIDARAASERAASDARREQAQRQAEAEQQRQFEWATTRKKLEGDVAELNVLLRSAQGRVLTSPLEDARDAAGEVQVYEARALAAQRALSMHLQSQPRRYA